MRPTAVSKPVGLSLAEKLEQIRSTSTLGASP